MKLLQPAKLKSAPQAIASGQTDDDKEDYIKVIKQFNKLYKFVKCHFTFISYR